MSSVTVCSRNPKRSPPLVDGAHALTAHSAAIHSISTWNDGTLMRKEKGTGKHHHYPTRSWPKLPLSRQFDDASAMFRALGEPSRLRLLTRLTAGEICVSELAELEAEKLTTISARLKTLHAAALVKRRREGKHIYYALSDSHVLGLVQNALEHVSERE